MADPIQDLQMQIADINQKVQQGGVTQAVIDTLQENKKFLQDKLDKLLSSKNIITPKGGDAFESLQMQKKSELVAGLKKNTTLLIVLGSIAIIGIGYYFYTKQNKGI